MWSICLFGQFLTVSNQRFDQESLSVDHVRVASKFDAGSILSGDSVDISSLIVFSLGSSAKVKVTNFKAQVHQVKSNWLRIEHLEVNGMELLIDVLIHQRLWTKWSLIKVHFL